MEAFIARLRKEKNLTQSELAEALGITVIELLQGERKKEDTICHGTFYYGSFQPSSLVNQSEKIQSIFFLCPVMLVLIFSACSKKESAGRQSNEERILFFVMSAEAAEIFSIGLIICYLAMGLTGIYFTLKRSSWYGILVIYGITVIYTLLSYVSMLHRLSDIQLFYMGVLQRAAVYLEGILLMTGYVLFNRRRIHTSAMPLQKALKS